MENVASFDYKTQEEVLLVIRQLTAILSTSGIHLVEILSPSHLLTTFRGAQSTAQDEGPDSALIGAANNSSIPPPDNQETSSSSIKPLQETRPFFVCLENNEISFFCAQIH